MLRLHNYEIVDIWQLCFQATVGKCNAPKPGMMDIVGKYKWNAWNDLGEMSQVLYQVIIVKKE